MILPVLIKLTEEPLQTFGMAVHPSALDLVVHAEDIHGDGGRLLDQSHKPAKETRLFRPAMLLLLLRLLMLGMDLDGVRRSGDGRSRLLHLELLAMPPRYIGVDTQFLITIAGPDFIIIVLAELATGNGVL